MRLKIMLPRNWSQTSSSSGQATFFRAGGTNAFQVSWAEYRGSKPLPEITADSLKRFAVNLGRQRNFGELVDSSDGKCAFGCFGSAVFRASQYPRIQMWIICNGQDHIIATHQC